MNDEKLSKAVRAYRDQFALRAFRWFFESANFTDEDFHEARAIWDGRQREIALIDHFRAWGLSGLKDLTDYELQLLEESPLLSIRSKITVNEFRRQEPTTRRATPPRRGFVYLALNKRNGFVKIGFSIQPATREATLQSEEPEIEFIYLVRGTTHDEQELHNRFEEKRIRGEWFRLSEEDIQTVREQYPL